MIPSKSPALPAAASSLASKPPMQLLDPSTTSLDCRDWPAFVPDEIAAQLEALCRDFQLQLEDGTVSDDTIRLCGSSPLKLLQHDPDEALELSYLHLHASPFSKVPLCWRRLCEEATLRKAFKLLHRRQMILDEFFSEVVTLLDQGLIVSGAPARRGLFDWLFQRLAAIIPPETWAPECFPIATSGQGRLQPTRPMHREEHAVTMQDFQHHLTLDGNPIIIPGSISHWPAMEKWHNPNYFLRETLGGRRMVPVEIGSSYTDEDWSQTLMSFRDYCRSYLLGQGQDTKGYLAQHELFTQIPALRNDIAVPDYCYTTPEPPQGAAALTMGLASTPMLDEPLVNAWIGPERTTTPLHTDAYHNILCQVVGYKYVRLYAPECRKQLSPLGVDDKGVDMSNTSGASLESLNSQSVDYVDGILAPGECLYVPLGWWHYVESLSVSASVSFWWN